MTPPIRIGILGAARIARQAIFAPVKDNPEFEIVAVGSRDKSRAVAYAAENDIPFVADGYSELVARDDIDLVYNALPPAGHAKWSIEALNAGKAVLCEKPFSLTAAEASEMVAVAERTNRPLIEAFHYRHHSIFRRAIEITASGELGRLLEAEAAFDTNIGYRPGELRWLPNQGGGALMDLGCYCVHVLRTVAACEPEVTSAACNIVHGVDETTVAALSFPGGLRAKLHTSMNAPASVSPLHVRGEKGSLHLSRFAAPHLGCVLSTVIDGVQHEEQAHGETTYAGQLSHVADVLLRGASPLTGGADAIANMACIDAIYNAAGCSREFSSL